MGQQAINAQKQIPVGSNNPVLKFGGPGNGKGKFCYPCGIVIDNENCLHVADFGNGLIQKFTADGKFLNQFCVKNGENSSTLDIALDLNRGLMFCTETSGRTPWESNGGKRLHVFNLEGELQNTYTPVM